MKKFTSYTRGFTLIELLVVIAIIGILASVVLVSLGSARSKGKDAAIQEQLSSLRSAVELAANGGSYTGILSGGTTPASTDNNVSSIIAGLNAQGSANKFVVTNGTTWAASWQGVGSTTAYYCVDSGGFAGATSTILTAQVTMCR